MDSIYAIASDACELGRDDLRVAGSVYKASVIDRSTEQSLRNCTIPSALLTLVVVMLLLRSTRLTLVVLIASAYCGALSIAMIHYTSDGINAVLLVVPTLIYVLTVSGAVHLANYYRDARQEVPKQQAGFRAVQVGWKPCALAAFSTAIGMASLIVSDLAPIRSFGIYAAIAVLVSFVVFDGGLFGVPDAQSVRQIIGQSRPRSANRRKTRSRLQCGSEPSSLVFNFRDRRIGNRRYRIAADDDDGRFTEKLSTPQRACAQLPLDQRPSWASRCARSRDPLRQQLPPDVVESIATDRPRARGHLC